MNGTFLRLSAAFVTAALAAISVSLYLSDGYLEDQAELANNGDTDGAMQKIELASRLDPFSAEPLLAEAALLQNQGENQEAESALRAAAGREPNNYEIPQELGQLRLGSMNQPLEASESYERALELNPKSDVALAGAASAYLSAGKLEEAKKKYEKLREAGDMSLDQMYDLGRIYVRTGEPGKGVRILRRTSNRAEANLQSVPEELREEQIGFARSVELAIADGLVVQRRYAAARRIVANSSAEQAPTILSLINSNPEAYRRTVVNSDVY